METVTMSDQSTQLASLRPDQWSGMLRPVMGDALTSLAIDTTAGKRDLVRAYQEDGHSITEHINTVIDIRDVLIHPAQSMDDVTGVVHIWPRVVLFLRDGTLITCGSEGVLKSLKLGLIVNGPLPWASAKAKVRQQELGSGRRWYILDWQFGDDKGAKK